jgi:hypothetical protein
MPKRVRCLLVKLADGRVFFTKKKNARQLLEFSRVCNARLRAVEAVEPPLATLQDLVERACDLNYKTPPTYYRLERKTQ